MIARILALAGLSLVSACTVAPPAAISSPVWWLEGCWRSVDGATTERWTIAAPDHAFASSVSEAGGETVFFEMLHIQSTAEGTTLNAYPRGVGPTPFREIASDTASITFQNTAHDYPQNITYRREGSALNAVISLADGSNENRWQFTPCTRE